MYVVRDYFNQNVAITMNPNYDAILIKIHFHNRDID